jgi:hypothetical protein
METLKKLFRFKKTEDVLIIQGSGESVVEKKKTSGAEIFYFSCLALLVASLFFTFSSTGNLIVDHDISWREMYRLVNEKKSLQSNLESLEQLSKRIDTIKKEQSIIEQAVPFEPWNEQVMSFVEAEVEQIKKKNYLEMPENISWRLVSASDVSNEDLADLEIYQYAVSLTGSSEGVIQFIKSLRNSLRFLDVRSLSNYRQDPVGNVSADLVFWAYNLSTL